MQSVVAGNPAESAGMQAGDQLLRLDGEEIATQDDLRKVLAAHKPGDAVAFQAAADFAKSQFGFDVTESEIRGRLEEVVFGVPDPVNPGLRGLQVLRGDYNAVVRITV